MTFCVRRISWLYKSDKIVLQFRERENPLILPCLLPQNLISALYFFPPLHQSSSLYIIYPSHFIPLLLSHFSFNLSTSLITPCHLFSPFLFTPSTYIILSLFNVSPPPHSLCSVVLLLVVFQHK